MNGTTSANRAALEGRVALVTGASRGIGAAIALELASHGAAVVVNYRRDEAAARRVVQEIEARGGSAVAVPAALPGAVEDLAKASLDAYGFVDLLVANAGIASRGLSVAETDLHEVEHVMAVHAFSTHRLASLLLPLMRGRSRGDIVVISSSEVTAMRANGAPYNMAKAALEALALTLAKEEAGNGIRVNIVAPGLTVTDMGARLVKANLDLDDPTALDMAQPFGRLCRPEDIARVVRFLASGEASHVTGQRIVVDGGVDAFPEKS